MRLFLTFAFLFHFLCCFSQQGYVYPKIKESGYKISDFIPKGWTLLDTASGDLNKDSVSDLAIVIQLQDSSLINDDNEFRAKDFWQPRILAIFFQDSVTKKYTLAEQCDKFIVANSHSNMKDPFEGLSIDNNILTINFRILYTIGWKYTSTHSYKFQYRNEDFVLIRASSHSFHKETGKSQTYDIDFLKGKYSITSGNEFNIDKKPSVSWKTFKMPLRTFKSFPKPFTWQFTDEIIL
jgi:hypothetical protein